MNTLFRKEAIQARSRDDLNQVILSPGKSIDRLIVCILVVVVVIIAASTVVEFPRTVSANGTLKSNQGSVKMYLESPVIIDRVLVSNDSIVERDDAIAIVHLNADQSRANLDQQQDNDSV